MMGRWGQSDLLAGTVAAAALLLLVRALDENPLWAIPLAIAIYVGIVLLRPQRHARPVTLAGDPIDLDDNYRAALASAVAIRALGPGVSKPAVREQVGRIADKIDRNLAAIREDGNLSAAPIFTSSFLDTYEKYLDDYVCLSNRDVKSASRGLQKFETHDLPNYERAVDDFYEQLHRQRVVDLEALSDELESNLKSITPPSEHVPDEPPALPSENGDAPRPAGSVDRRAVVNAELAARFGLTAREAEIVQLLAQRLRNREIADLLFISKNTAQNHVYHILGKLGLANRDDVRKFLEEHDLLLPPKPPNENE